ncbi:hypothetical protein [Subtercola sp. RTI3]|uniref:hypothetical protein n=1 Tax=Subtercola sp. RTI3 TaxID=3048639 RepID=UPI002B22BBC9|nr:hypothetical protein [Subtercola sp. RTI3]MEA9985678.1 hypothetical protein [Subtercola sp. RTI3]
MSDISGVEGVDEDFVTVIVRKHPKLEEPVQFDALPDEIKSLKSAGDLVVLEIKNGETKQVVVTLAEFNKIAPNIDAILENADGLKGRRKGFRPGQ